MTADGRHIGLPDRLTAAVDDLVQVCGRVQLLAVGVHPELRVGQVPTHDQAQKTVRGHNAAGQPPVGQAAMGEAGTEAPGPSQPRARSMPETRRWSIAAAPSPLVPGKIQVTVLAVVTRAVLRTGGVRTFRFVAIVGRAQGLDG